MVHTISTNDIESLPSGFSLVDMIDNGRISVDDLGPVEDTHTFTLSDCDMPDDMPDDFDPAQQYQDERDDTLLEAGVKPCDVCGKPVEYKTGCHRCTVPVKKWSYDGWGQARHLPDKTDSEYVNLLSSFGYDDHEMLVFFNEYLLAMMRYYKDFSHRDFAVAHYLFSECRKSGRVTVSYSGVTKATGVSRNAIRGRADRPDNESVLKRLERLGVIELLEDGSSSKQKVSLYLRLRWNPRDNIGITTARRDEVYRLVMMGAEQKGNHKKKKKNRAKKDKLRSQGGK